MVTMPTTTNIRVSNSSIQSKWEISRRSICTDLSAYAHLLFVGNLLLCLHEFFKDFFRHGRGSITAVTAMFNQHGDGDLRILRRRISDKPGMVAIEIGQLFGFYVARFHFDDLSRAGLAGNLNQR